MRIFLVIKLVAISSFIILPLVGAPHYLTCQPDYLYPVSFLSIFALDAILACWDLVVLMFTPNDMRKAFKRKLEMRKKLKKDEISH